MIMQMCLAFNSSTVSSKQLQQQHQVQLEALLLLLHLPCFGMLL
jgi:hypothetical protein